MGWIAEPTTDPTSEHAFGGAKWGVAGPAGAVPQPALLLTLDLADSSLGLDGSAVPELPLCSRLDGDSVGPQSYSFDSANHRVVFDGPSWQVTLDPRDALPVPLPRTPLRLRTMTAAEESPQASSVYDVQDTFLGGSAFIRVRGEPLWLDEPAQPVCACGRDMVFVACIGYENYDQPSGLVSPTLPFFIGELALYFFACLRCQRCAVLTQTT